MELPAISLTALQQSGYYEGTLVGAGVLGSLVLIVGWANFKPWWGAKQMRAEREKVTNKIVASDILWSLRHMVKDNQLTVEEGEMYYKRFANLIPLKDMVKDTSFKTIKEILLEKHSEQEEAPKATVVEKQGAFARMSARVTKPATA